MNGAVKWLAWVSGVLLVSCSGGDGSNTKQRTAPFTYAIAPAALAGCRAPSDPGCFRCCTGTGADGRCAYQEGANAASPSASTDYSVSGSYAGPCAADCPACAPCSAAAEKTLREIQPRPDCDCATIQPIVDPCFGAGSCDCYCSIVNDLLDVCAPAGD